MTKSALMQIADRYDELNHGGWPIPYVQSERIASLQIEFPLPPNQTPDRRHPATREEHIQDLVTAAATIAHRIDHLQNTGDNGP